MTPKLLALLALASSVLPVQAAQEDEARYLLGASVSVSPEYDGASQYAAKIRPVWALKFGRVRIASGGGSALLGFGRGGAGPGASTQLVESGRWRAGLSLRVDSGRDSGDADTTRGLPDVKRTLRARVYANYSLAPDWNLGASLSQDALGRGGGLVGSLDLGWRFFRSDSTEWSSGIGLTGGNAQNLRSYFGVPDFAATPDRPAYRPGAGLRDAYVGVGVRHALDKHWFVFGSAGRSRLLGPAADSPLVQKTDSQTVAIGLAWRN
ncbi:MipA/OmpV family protein [Roseateles sp. LKC17W]|uniref:MipA/OmpV family protein n=1 Tax=Pelomonas margarita TaxID=3299031 RepID=A0ABW7FIV9_9BURK